MTSIPALRLYPGTDARLQRRIVTSDQAIIATADITSWKAKVYDGKKLLKTLIDTSTTTGYFYDTLQTGNGWSRDALGYNFEYVVNGDAFAHEGGRQYRVEFDVTTADDKIRFAWVLHYQPWMGTP